MIKLDQFGGATQQSHLDTYNLDVLNVAAY